MSKRFWGFFALFATAGIASILVSRFFAQPVFADEESCFAGCSATYTADGNACYQSFVACNGACDTGLSTEAYSACIGSCEGQHDSCDHAASQRNNACRNSCLDQIPSEPDTPTPPVPEPVPSPEPPSAPAQEPSPEPGLTCGENEYLRDNLCYCNAGYARLNRTCVPVAQWCGTTYGAHVHAENERCACDPGYEFLDDACVTYDQGCQAEHGKDSYGDKEQCYCRSGYVFNEKMLCVPESKQTPASVPVQPTVVKNVVAEFELSRLLEKIGYTGDISQVGTPELELLVSALQYERLARNVNSGRLKRNEADAALSQALDDRSITDPLTLERIRKMYLDSWLDDPRNKKTNMMLAMLEREKGNASTADIYERFAYANLSATERDALSSGAGSARAWNLDEIFREKEAMRRWKEQESKRSSFMNRMKSEIDAEMAQAQETTKEICRKIGPCDWAYAKKVEITTKAEHLSKKVRDLMNDPLKEIFGIDKKQMLDDLSGKR